MWPSEPKCIVNSSKTNSRSISFGVYLAQKGASLTSLVVRDVKFGIQTGSDWPQIGQIWDFLKSVFSTFWLGEKTGLKM